VISLLHTLEYWHGLKSLYKILTGFFKIIVVVHFSRVSSPICILEVFRRPVDWQPCMCLFMTVYHRTRDGTAPYHRHCFWCFCC
jgi:hypothetical protein